MPTGCSRKELDEDWVGGVLDEDTVSVVKITMNQRARWGWLVEIKGKSPCGTVPKP